MKEPVVLIRPKEGKPDRKAGFLLQKFTLILHKEGFGLYKTKIISRRSERKA